MRILALECSAAPASCCLLDNGRMAARAATHDGATHSQTLLPMVRETLRLAGRTVAEMDYLAVAAGPGSFTGVRIGVAAVKGLAFPGNTPCVPVSTLGAMARRLEGLPFSGTVCAAMDARCRQVYTALFTLSNGRLTRQTPDEALTLDELLPRLQSSGTPILLVGDGAELCYNTFVGALPDLTLAPPAWRYQDAVGVALEAAVQIAAGGAVDGAALRPQYLRLPQAERELRARQAGTAGNVPVGS